MSAARVVEVRESIATVEQIIASIQSLMADCERWGEADELLMLTRDLDKWQGILEQGREHLADLTEKTL